jgi:carbonic anhydrase
MSSVNCNNATAPINIVSNNSQTCDLKCNFSNNYTVTSVSAENKGGYIRYTFDTANVPPVTFNAEQYNVSDMKLYQPSLHKYGGVTCDAELIIYHTNITQNANVIVSVPIMATSTSTGVMDTLISQVASRANSEGGKTTIGIPSFSLSNIVPSAPFYNYVGTFPVYPCISSVEYVVFDKPHAITITSSSLIQLKKIITQHSYSTRSNTNGLFYNKTGPTTGNGAAGDGIYIECNPTGADGNVLVKQGSTLATQADPNDTVEYITKLFNNPWVSGLLGAFVLIILLYIFHKLFNLLPATKPNGALAKQNVAENFKAAGAVHDVAQYEYNTAK